MRKFSFDALMGLVFASVITMCIIVLLIVGLIQNNLVTIVFSAICTPISIIMVVSEYKEAKGEKENVA